MNANIRKQLLFTVLFAAVAFVLLLFCGAEKVSPANAWDVSTSDHRILFSLRLPRLLLCLLVGGALSMVGASYQILFQNPLAEPYLLGVASAVTLGFVSGEQLLHLSSGSAGSHLLGVLLGLLAAGTLMGLSLTRAGREPNRLVLFGMALNFVLSSFLFVLVSFASEQVGGSLRWLFGQIPWVTFPEMLPVAVVVLPACVALLLLGRQLDVLAYGDVVARSLGADPRRIRMVILLVTGLVLAFTVSLTGSVGFVGLVVPHAVRLLFRTTSTRPLLFLSFFVGGIFLCGSDVVSRVLMAPFEFPIGTITTLLGGPLFLYLLVKR